MGTFAFVPHETLSHENVETKTRMRVNMQTNVCSKHSKDAGEHLPTIICP